MSDAPAQSPRGREADAVRVLYVGGLPRSGSTLTDLLLHHLPGHIGVGELFYLWRNCVVEDGLCSCGDRFSRCDFWQAVGDEAYGGWDNVDVADVLAWQATVDTTSAIPRMLALPRAGDFGQTLARYTEVLALLYRAIRRVSGKDVVVDSSKRPSLAFILRGMPSIALDVVQVVRDPRGVAYSFGKHVALEPGVALKAEMPRSSARKVARRWVTVNAAIASLARLGVPLVRIRYEDLVLQPERELRRVLALEHADPDAGGLDFLTPEGVVIPATHSIASGRIRLQTGVIPLRLDDAWRTAMPARDQRLVGAITALSRRRYGYP